MATSNGDINSGVVNFDTLYSLYSANKLVFIMGSELLKLEKEDKTFEQKAIEKITRNSPDVITRPKSYVDLAIRYPKAINGAILQGIFNVEKEQGFEIRLLQLIADFPKISLFVTTTFDDELQSCFDPNKVEEVVWNHTRNEPLYLNLKNGKKKIVYLFGKFDSGDVSFFEEEQLECLLSLSSYNEKSRSVTQEKYSLLEYMKDKTLVFIGINSSDWFLRLMIRTLYNTPMFSRPNKAYIINDKRSEISFEKYFFEKFQIELIHDFPIDEWLNKLHDHIRAKETFDDWYKPRRIFISYDRTDKEVANNLKKCLNLKHIDAFLDTEDMGIANHEIKIKDLIQSADTCVFVCILSATLAKKSKQESYVKRVEWKTASEKCVYNRVSLAKGQTPAPFIISSYAVDDFNLYKDSLDEFILDNNILNPPLTSLDRFCNMLEETIKNIQK
ncbi:MAG: toll/interleukin-1 receptor domain-containing protein [Chitinophagaceae bacterium]